jgi:glutathione peroxidase
MTDLPSIPVTTIDGRTGPLGAHLGRATLVVNVASKCGFTPQYEGLEALYRKHKDAGLVILGFPCDQFAHQEPGSDAEIQQFCRLTYDVTFPLFQKVEVNGEGAHPLYRALKAAAPGLFGTQRIKWNFTKFLLDRDGRVVARFAPSTPPRRLEAAIARLLEPAVAPAAA